MKTILANSTLLASLLASSASAQHATSGPIQKPLPTKNGHAVHATHVTPPHAPLVGGSDGCTTPDVVTGTGTFAYDTNNATQGVEGQNESLCNQFGTTNIETDVWFVWNSTITGTVDFSSCAGTGADTKIAVYAGTACPITGSSLACNDDFCAFESNLQFSATTGSSYVLQIGSYPGSGGNSGTFTLGVYVPPVPPVNDDCSTPTVISGAGPFPYDTRLASTGAQGQGNGICNFAGTTGITEDQWYTWTPSSAGAVTLTTCNGIDPASPDYDTKVAIYTGSGCPVGTAIACNDDDGGCGVGLESTVTWNAVCGQTYTIQLGRYPGAFDVFGTFDIVESGPNCISGSPFCFGTATACPCANAGTAGNGCASSVNANGANLAATGTSSVSADTVVITGTGMPNGTCLYYQGTLKILGGAGAIFGDGLRCVGGTVIRLGTKTNTAGASNYPSGTDTPISVRGAVPPGGATREYQCWYRNSASFCTTSTFNLTNGLEIVWMP